MIHASCVCLVERTGSGTLRAMLTQHVELLFGEDLFPFFRGYRDLKSDLWASRIGSTLAADERGNKGTEA